MLTWIFTTGTPFWAWTLVSIMFLYAIWVIANELKTLKHKLYKANRRITMLEQAIYPPLTTTIVGDSNAPKELLTPKG